MIDNFPIFARAVEARWQEMTSNRAGGEVYIVDNDRDVIWEHYLASFPEGTNPHYRERTEHDCSCCKQFVRGVGNVVAIRDGQIQTIWQDLPDLPEPYATVAKAMDLYVRQFPIKTIFRTKEPRYGQARTLEYSGDGKTITWNHFEANITGKFHNREPATEQGEFNTNLSVYKRGLLEIKPEAIVDVLGLIKDNQLYRGSEFKKSVQEFQAYQLTWDATPEDKKEQFILETAGKGPQLIKNTAIGTLLVDLSNGEALEAAVAAFEFKVAPQNYKRPKALISKSMIADAMKTVKDLNLEPALERRMARFSDVNVNDVLFVDTAVAPVMKGGLESKLLEEVKDKPVKVDNPEQIAIEDFLESIVPKATSLDLLLSSEMQSNFMSLTAPVHDDVEPLFKWPNNFAWSYDGNVTDSIKERVRTKGGNVDNAVLRCSLSWFNTDDLDIHMMTPLGREIYYGGKGQPSSGQLDVDANYLTPYISDPVENISWTKQPVDGAYTIVVNNFTFRERLNPGCIVEIEYKGKTHHFKYDKVLPKDHPFVQFAIKDGELVDIKVGPDVSSTTLSVEKWGVTTEKLVKVNALMLSPNHWGDAEVGNKHWFFLLEGAKNPEPVRGIYNEFLSNKLDKHRKVFEILGEKTKAEPSDDQMSGVGFSSTRHDKAVIVAKGPGLNKAYEVTF